MQVFRTFSDDIHMEFGLDKCTKIVLKLVHSQHLLLDFNRELQNLEKVRTCKYLGTAESENIHHQQMKERLKKEYTRRLRMIQKSEFECQ
jgi:hypothetical protein